MKRLVAVAALSLLAHADEQQDQAKVKHHLPQLSSVFPQGAEPGTTLEVEVLGQHLDRAKAVLCLDPQVRGRILENSHTRMKLELAVHSDTSFGPHYFRVVTPRGPSNILLFRVGDQPHVLEVEPNGLMAAAKPVSIPVTLNGTTFDPVSAAADVNEVTMVLRAGDRAPKGNIFNLAILGKTVEGRVEQAPQINLLID